MLALICDDLAENRRMLAEYCARYGKEKNTDLQTLQFKKAGALLQNKETPDADILFLDIYMEGASGIDAAADKFIQLKVLERDDKIFIRMENSFENIVIQDDGKYLSTKAGRNYAEGIGLSSIKAAAAKYGGIADFSHKEKVFISSVLLHQN